MQFSINSLTLSLCEKRLQLHFHFYTKKGKEEFEIAPRNKTWLLADEKFSPFKFISATVICFETL